MFSNEAMLWGQLVHPNILTVFGLFRFQGRVALVMPWVENGDITKYLKTNPDAPRLLLADDVAKGLAYLHKNGVIHGDLKGSNILIDDAGHARLCDFGISSISDQDIISWTTQSQGASRGGSIRWQAPELFNVANGDDEEEPEVAKNSTESDAYAWGCVCLEIFTGQVPFAQLPNEFSVMLRVQSGARPSRPPKSSPAWTAWGLTDDIWSLMQSCWDREPSHRPSASTIVEKISAKLNKDTRPILEADEISPAGFRGQMGEPLDMITVEDLDRLLFPHKTPDPPVTSQEVQHRTTGDIIEYATFPLYACSKYSSLRHRTHHIVFIIDDSGSMTGSNWFEARDSLLEIADRALDSDIADIDLRFLNSSLKFHGIKGRTKIIDIFEAIQPSGPTPLGSALDAVLQEYLTRLERVFNTFQYATVKPLGVIVLTDGVPTDQPGEVLSKALARLRVIATHPLNAVSIQIIQIGDDRDAIPVLQQLASGDLEVGF
ncbi:hypothetical protein H0H87_009901 [Tephrocybe sp. NHM501043]|nr:hypothetical protein H0H87_009901 [Tephrocybe sp. NHM501043]